MRKFLSTLSLLALSLLLLSCGKYRDAKSAMNDTAEVMEAYADEVEAADSPKEIAAAMDRLTESFKELGPRLREMDGKHPNLNMAAPPEELREAALALEKANRRMMEATYEATKDLDDPEVMKAKQRLIEARDGL
ncbi:MAG: hypothetical protein R3242_00225 [Akkermansiaceae bacterium]|nr:hypothetical protein [Akkermansiaceae bacterium]